jgi:nicotinamide-nucleotide amidase
MQKKMIHKLKGEKSTTKVVHLVAIGNELLNAETRDTNLAWLIKFFTRKGGNVVRAAIIPDDFEAIKSEIDSAIEKKVDLVATTGGLGPTDDDATLRAIGEALDLTCSVNKEALAMVRERVNYLAKMRGVKPYKMTPERKSMAVFPEGSEPLRNPSGAAPGMRIEVGGTTLISLPGVPREMKAIVTETLKEFWEDIFEGESYAKRNIILQGIPEADLAPFIRKVNKVDPGVYIKSKIKSSVVKEVGKSKKEPRLHFEIVLHFSVVDKDRKAGLERLDRLVNIIVNDLRKEYKEPIEIGYRG